MIRATKNTNHQNKNMATVNESEKEIEKTQPLYTLRSRSIPLKDDAELKRIQADQYALRRRGDRPTNPVVYGKAPYFPYGTKVEKRLRRTSTAPLLTRHPKTVGGLRMLGYARRAINSYNKQCTKGGKPTYKGVKLRRAHGVGGSLGAVIHLNFEAQSTDNTHPETFFADLFSPYIPGEPFAVRRCCSLGPKGSESAASGPEVCFHCPEIMHPTDGLFTGHYVYRNYDAMLPKQRLPEKSACKAS